jgi:hypothetical protein
MRTWLTRRGFVVTDSGLRALTARIAAGEAAHVSYLSSLAGHGVGAALPRPLSVEQATQQLAPFWG